MAVREHRFWRLSLATPMNGVLFDAGGGEIDFEVECLPADLVRQVAKLQLDTRAFWRRAVADLAKNPRDDPDSILARAGAPAVTEAAEAVIVALTLACPDVVLDVDIRLTP